MTEAANPTTLTMDEEKNITAVFTTTRVISASAGPHGSISPEGAIIVEHGGIAVFTITPNPGFQIADVLVDGNSVGRAANFSFNPVTSDHTIQAFFEVRRNPQ